MIFRPTDASAQIYSPRLEGEWDRSVDITLDLIEAAWQWIRREGDLLEIVVANGRAKYRILGDTPGKLGCLRAELIEGTKW